MPCETNVRGGLKGRSDVVRLLVRRGARLETHVKGRRDTEDIGSIAAGARIQALDYADGLVRVVSSQRLNGRKRRS